MLSPMRLLPYSLVVLLLAGCAAQVPAPVREAGDRPGGRELAATPPLPGDARHVVRPGDTLFSISRRYGVPVRSLMDWNAIANPDQLYVGQSLVLSGAAAPATVTALPVREPGMQADTPAVTPVYDTPRGGVQPYSDAAWARLKGEPVPVATPAMPDTPVAGAPEPVAAAPAIATPETVSGAKAAGSSPWIWPVNGRILLGYNQPKDAEGKSLNQGIDIEAAPGTPVLAAADGQVLYAGSTLRGYGKLLIIRHKPDYQTVYAHNQELLVKEGDHVKQGQRIALSGSTDADRPKLHFEIRKQGGRTLDPATLLPKS